MEKSELEKHVDLLGRKVEDKVTGFKGVVSSISFDLYGCIQAVVVPPVGDDGDTKTSKWFDVARLVVGSGDPVMARPDFVVGPVAEGKKGPAEKPAQAY